MAQHPMTHPAKKLVDAVTQQTQENIRRYQLNIILGTIFFLIMLVSAKFGPSFSDILASLWPLLAVMALVGLIVLLCYRDMPRELQPPGQRFGDELAEYIFTPSPEFQQAYPNYPNYY